MFFYANSTGEEGVLRAFMKCGELISTGADSEFAIVLPELNTLDGIVSGVIGEDFAKTLRKRKKIDFGDGSIRLFFGKDPVRNFKGSLLFVYMEVEEIKPILLANPCADVVFVPMDDAEKALFVSEYSPELI
jgi:hypothetical protein